MHQLLHIVNCSAAAGTTEQLKTTLMLLSAGSHRHTAKIIPPAVAQRAKTAKYRNRPCLKVSPAPSYQYSEACRSPTSSPLAQLGMQPNNHKGCGAIATAAGNTTSIAAPPPAACRDASAAAMSPSSARSYPTWCYCKACWPAAAAAADRQVSSP